MPSDATFPGMVPLLHVVLLLVVSSHVLVMSSHVYGHDGGQEMLDESESMTPGCQCLKSENAKLYTDVASALKGSRTTQIDERDVFLGAPKSSVCSCDHETQLQKQSLSSFMPVRLPHKSALAFPSIPSLLRGSCAHLPPSLSYHICRSLTALSAMKASASPGESTIHHSFINTPSSSNNMRSHRSLFQSLTSSSHMSPSTAQGYGSVPPPSASAPHIAPTTAMPSPSLGPISPASQRMHYYRRHAPPKGSSPPVPAPGPKADISPSSPEHGHPSTSISPSAIPPSSPAHGHPSTSISPSADCSSVVCSPPLTKAPFLSPCGCVLPIQVEIELSVPLYAFFPLISLLAVELAEGTVLSPSQVEIIRANSSNQNQEFSVVDTNLVPLDKEFDHITALIIFQKLWNHEVVLNTTLFGNYSVVYVRYPALPPSPPSETDGGQLTGIAGIQQPFGVDVSKPSPKKLDIGTTAAIALCSVTALVICLGVVWLVLLKFTHRAVPPPASEPGLLPARTKRSGGRSFLSSDLGSSTSLSFTSSIATYASTARTFAFAELDRATDQFRPENIIGEGGFGRVFSGVLDDGTKVAVKVLTRDDQQGGKEFIAEVEMLSRLHHRNLVKLVGICAEEHSRCLVYELIPNGSVESHLHGVDKETPPLDWETRMKIALGSARGLAYLHEDSSPRVIHRDFKAGNILLENNFNPKVSDFGLAKVAPDEGSGHLSTRVMGTFGYVAPEYAMTGHLLVKSDVYSYGVVLLELLSGRKPVDMSQPSGQENLVTWARPLLTSKEGLKVLVDPALKNNFSFDNLARVAAIASMCVQPEVSHRPFMGEVVQALKLVYKDSDVNNGTGSSNCSQGGDSMADSDMRSGQHWIGQKAQYSPDDASFISMDYDSGLSQERERRPFSASALLHDSASFIQYHASSLKRHSLSGPLRPSRSKLTAHKQTGVQGSISEHAPLARSLTTGLGRDASCHDVMMQGNSLDFTVL